MTTLDGNAELRVRLRAAIGKPIDDPQVALISGIGKFDVSAHAGRPARVAFETHEDTLRHFAMLGTMKNEYRPIPQ